MNLAGKTFRAVSNSKNGNLNSDTLMRFTSDEGLVVGEYAGGSIVVGHVLARHTSDSELDMLYHGATTEGAHNAGKAHATIAPDSDGRLRMHLDWQWLTADQSRGNSEWVLVDSQGEK